MWPEDSRPPYSGMCSGFLQRTFYFDSERFAEVFSFRDRAANKSKVTERVTVLAGLQHKWFLVPQSRVGHSHVCHSYRLTSHHLIGRVLYGAPFMDCTSLACTSPNSWAM